MKRIIITLIIATLLLFGGCISQKSVNFGFARPKFDKVPAEIMAKIVNAGDAFTYPDANSIIIETVDSNIYNEDGSLVAYAYAISKPLTPQGLKNESKVELGYDSQMMDVEILYAGVIHPDSTIEFVPDSEIIDQVASEGMAEMDIYWTNLRKKIVQFPQLYPGDAVVSAYKYTFKKPYFEGVISGSAGFQSSEPIHHNRSVHLIPKSRASQIRYKIMNDSKGWIKFDEYDWQDYHIMVWEADSTPALVPEIGMPSPNQFIPLVLFSNVSWKELSRKAWEVTEPPMLISDPAVTDMVNSLVETCKTEMDSIKTIGLWVAQDVRYIGISLGDKEGITPHDVNETFSARAGVCKDKSALAVAMLREAGFEAYNVLTNPISHIIYDIATNQFNHQIIMARTRSGEEYFLDVTVDLDAQLPEYYSKKGYLVLSEQGEDLKYFPLYGPQKSMGTITAQSRIDPAGNLNSTVKISGNGVYELAIRQIGQFLEKEDRERLFRRLVNQIAPNAHLLNFSIEPENIKDLSIPAEITIEYEVPDYAIPAGDYLLLSVPCAQNTFNITAGVLEEYTKLEERKYPLQFMYTIGANTTETIELPSSYGSKSIPDKLEINNPYFNYNMEYKIEENIVKYRSTLKLMDIDIPLRHYADFRKAYTKYKNAEKGMLFLTREAQ
ncbi:hypothetical protein DRQ33_08680 [bacterium]|nr:MAG: hypothetical protein DRQ33_08680 [bacterium]